jgi:hypothetical protein
MAKQEKKKNFSGAFGKLMSNDYQAEKVNETTPEKKTQKLEKKESAKPVKKRSSMLEGLKGSKKQYQLVRIEQGKYDDFVKIAKDENISFPGQLINFALGQWLEKYYEEIS